MSHFILSEEQEHCIYQARYTLRLVADMASAIPPGKQLTLDPEALSIFADVTEKLLPSEQSMTLVSDR